MQSKGRVWRGAVGLLVVLAGGAVGGFVPRAAGPPRERVIEMTARQYAYDPPALRVGAGDTVRLRIKSLDVVHGFYLEGYDIDATIVPQNPYLTLYRPSGKQRPARVEEIVFTAARTGKFRYRCSQTCGTMHPFMSGELVVEPNRVQGAGIGLLAGVLLAGGLLALWGAGRGAGGPRDE